MLADEVRSVQPHQGHLAFFLLHNFCLWFCCRCLLISYSPLSVSCWALKVIAIPRLLQGQGDCRHFTLKWGIIEVNCSDYKLFGVRDHVIKFRVLLRRKYTTSYPVGIQGPFVGWSPLAVGWKIEHQRHKDLSYFQKWKKELLSHSL